jgi:hemolysin activation/secretion protein
MTHYRWCLGVFALLVSGHAAVAQVPVGAGGQIQQIPSVALPQNPAPVLPIPRNQITPLSNSGGTRFGVSSLRVSGQTSYSQSELIAVSGFHPGQNFTLRDLQVMAARITNYYNLHGYFVARAYLPPQDITDGIVTISVIEGRYGQIGLRNQTNVSDAVYLRILGGLSPGDTIEGAPLERRLLIISDLPGVRVNAVLAPGAAVGTANLAVGVTQGPRFDGDIEADNWGNPYTGAYRVGGTVNWNEPFGHGDVLSFRTLESTTGGLDYNRLSYQTQVNDTTVGAALTLFNYRLGKQFRSLDANGYEAIASLYASYPLIRSYNNNLYLLTGFDQRFFQDNVGATSSSIDKRAAVLDVGIAGDFIDGFGGGGSNNYAATVTLGDLSIETASARTLDSETAQTNGVYAKISASASRLQNLIGPLTLFMEIRGQLASKNLDVSEKMELGGAQGVRAYPEGEAYGDDGYIATLEPRLLLPTPAWLPGQLQAIAFIDNGYVKVDHAPFSNAQNGLSRTGAGAGLTWSDANGFLVTATYAHILGNNKATSYPDDAGEFWIEAIKYF